MLYLKYPHDAADEGRARIALSEQTALRLERALLAGDQAERRQELRHAVAQDEQLAAWALRTAELRLNRSVNQPDQAAEWLAGRLPVELSKWLVGDASCPAEGEHPISWRLPALVHRLQKYEWELSDFHTRLEHEKLESLKELAYGASHEINNPLANIAARAQTLLAGETDPERARKLQAIHRQAMRAHEMIADLMLFARPPKLTRSHVDVRELLARIVDELQGIAEEFEVELDSQLGADSLGVQADQTQLGVALKALVSNALEAVAAGGRVELEARRAAHGEAHHVEIVVRDDGPGISDEVRPHIFDPFFSGREAGRGLGFGLSKSWRIIREHGGEIVVQRPGLAGAEFIVRLPMAPVHAAAERTRVEC